MHDKDDIVEALRARLAIAAVKAAASAEDGGGEQHQGSMAIQLTEENTALMTANRALEAKIRWDWCEALSSLN